MPTLRMVKAVDRQELYRDYEDWPAHCQSALDAEVSIPDTDGVINIVVAGMGGSGSAGDVLQDWLTPFIDVPIHVLKEYHLPKFVSRESLVVAVSCSGETEETLNIFGEARQKGARLAAVSSGGTLRSASVKHGIPHTHVKRLLTPRSSFPYLLYPAAKIAVEALQLKGLQRHLKRSVQAVGQTQSEIRVLRPARENPSKQLARMICASRPVIYGSSLNRSAAYRFKNSLNEDAKLHALVEAVPELCHNDIEAWAAEEDDSWLAILLRFDEEPPEIRERFEIVKGIIRGRRQRVFEVRAKGGDALSMLMSTIYIGDYASLYAAVLRGIDPCPTPHVERVKAEVRHRLNP